MKNAKHYILCVCNQTQNTIRNKFLTFIKKQFKQLQLINHDLSEFISCIEQEIHFIFLKIISNLSLYPSDRYDKNLSLSYIWSDVYLNVLFWVMGYAARSWSQFACNNPNIETKTSKLRPILCIGGMS